MLDNGREIEETLRKISVLSDQYLTHGRAFLSPGTRKALDHMFGVTVTLGGNYQDLSGGRTGLLIVEHSLLILSYRACSRTGVNLSGMSSFISQKTAAAEWATPFLQLNLHKSKGFWWWPSPVLRYLGRNKSPFAQSSLNTVLRGLEAMGKIETKCMSFDDYGTMQKISVPSGRTKWVKITDEGRTLFERFRKNV